jgi:hypothetical protein
MTEIDYWYEKWTALPFTLRHLLLYLLYASGNGDDGVECVLIDRDLLGTEPQELSRSWEVFTIRDGVRVSQWVPPPSWLFDELLADLNHELDFDEEKQEAILNLIAPMSASNVIVKVCHDRRPSVFIRFLEWLEPSAANAMVEYIGQNGMQHLCVGTQRSR